MRNGAGPRPSFEQFKRSFLKREDIRLHSAEELALPGISLYLTTQNRLTLPPKDYYTAAWPGGRKLADHILKHRKEFEGKRVLDICAGSGVAGLAAARAGADVTVLDNSFEAIYAARINANTNGLRVKTVEADCLTFNEYGQFDIILIGDGIYSEAVPVALIHALDNNRITAYIGEHSSSVDAWDLKDPKYGIARPGVEFDPIKSKKTGAGGDSLIKITSHYPIRPLDRMARQAQQAEWHW